MRKIISTTFVSLDGVMQAPGGPEEDTSGGFELGGWIAPFMDAAVTKILSGVYTMPYDLLLGRRTYDIFSAYWPNVEKDPKKPGYDAQNAKIGKEFDAVKKYVATHAPETCTWQHSRWLGENIIESLRRIKDEDGPPLLLVGSSNLFQSLTAHRLVDEIQMLVFPVVLGNGKRLFAEGAKPTGFKVIESTTTPSGVMATTYAASGDAKTGSADRSAATRSQRSDQAHA